MFNKYYPLTDCEQKALNVISYQRSNHISIFTELSESYRYPNAFQHNHGFPRVTDQISPTDVIIDLINIY